MIICGKNDKIDEEGHAGRELMFVKIYDLEPKKVFYYFNEICKIPHGSGNLSMISDYIISFAKSHELSYAVDRVGNIAVYKDGTGAGKDCEPLILQGHIDMVCAKAEDVKKDMEREAVEVLSDGEYIWANGTTLGADDGIGVAYMLAILSDDTIVHPPITALFTVDEETGMIGAAQIDKDILRGKRLINIDSEEEGVFTVSCAGGARVICNIPVDFAHTADEMKAFNIEIYGLKGGHSGIDIGREHLNAICVLGRLMRHIPCDFGITEIVTGDKLNVIPQHASVKIVVAAEDKDLTRDVINMIAKKIVAEAQFEPDFGIKITRTAIGEIATTPQSSRIIAKVLSKFPDGVRSRKNGKIEASINIGMARLGADLCIGAMLRSNVEAEKNTIINDVCKVVDTYGGKVMREADYPSWEYNENSPLRDTMVEVYCRMFGVKPQIESIHAGLECGLFADLMPEIDMVSLGPDLEGVHTPQERMSIASARRVWEYLVALLGDL